MKIIKTIGIILVVLAALIVVVGLFMPSKFDAERSLVINAPQEQLFNEVNNLKNWNNWNAWNKIDPNWKVTYSEAEAGVGASYSWISDNSEVGVGKVTINKSEPMGLVEGTMEFDGMNPAKIYHTFEPVEGGVKVTFGIHSDLGRNIIRKLFFGVMGNKVIGGNYDQSLANLSQYVKDNPAKQEEPEVAAPTNDSANAGDSLIQN
jgi:hypothetical protein